MSLICAIIKFVIVAACLFYFYTVIADARSSVRERKKKKEKKAEEKRREEQRDKEYRERERRREQIKRDGYLNQWGIRCWSGRCWICGEPNGRGDAGFTHEGDSKPCSACHGSMHKSFGYGGYDVNTPVFNLGKEIREVPSPMRDELAGLKMYYAMQFSKGNIAQEAFDKKMKEIDEMIEEEVRKEQARRAAQPKDIRQAAAELTRKL